MFFFNDTATTEIYTLSLHDALPILHRRVEDLVAGLAQRLGAVHGGVGVAQDVLGVRVAGRGGGDAHADGREDLPDRKSTRLNSSHANISYAAFCLKKKKTRSMTRSP